ncbi:MAG TPA: YceI family protein [Acidimicrobiia bacterium]|nr:YceI family protein [Acidimicrobiia bacterium]
MTPDPVADPPRRRFHHWKRWVLGGVVLVVVLAVAVPYIYIHFIEGPAPARFSLSKTKTSTGGAAAVRLAGTWKVAGGSQAGYRIGEVLFGQSNTAVGRTTAVTGQLTIGPADRVDTTTITVDLTKVSSDQSQRDDQFQNRIMNTARFPTTSFALTKPIPVGSLPAPGTTVHVSAAGTLTLHGVTRPVQAAVAAQETGSAIQVSGSIPITFADWNISNPSGGPASTNDHGLIEFLLTFHHA